MAAVIGRPGDGSSSKKREKRARGHRLDAWDGRRGRVERAQVQGLGEAEAVGVEEAQRSVGSRRLESARRTASSTSVAEAVARDADEQLELERDVGRRADLEVVSGLGKALDVGPDSSASLPRVRRGLGVEIR